MGTSRSGEEAWTAGASVFSGRPEPTWQVPADLGLELAQLWERLLPWSGKQPLVPPLGYRGCTLSAPGGRVWTAFHDLVTLRGEQRRDRPRAFQQRLLASAPPGVLPPLTL